MIHDNILFHNAEELVPESGGLLLQRVPEAVRLGMEPGGQTRAQQAANTELRFVLEGPVKVTLSAPDGPILMREYRGDIQVFAKREIGVEPTVIAIEPEFGYLPAAADRPELRGAFHPRVVRLTAGGAQPASRLVYHGAEGAHRIPLKDEMPAMRMLTYGTSITQGFNATQPHMTWPAIAARELGLDLINLGMAGACQCERSIADHIAARGDWDVAVLELSVNMADREYGLFRERVGHLVRSAVKGNPGRTVVAVTLLPHTRDLGLGSGEEPSVRGNPETYRQILRNVVSECGSKDVHLIEGRDVLPRYEDLAVDLVHPTDHGMMRIGLHVAGVLKRVLGPAA